MIQIGIGAFLTRLHVTTGSLVMSTIHEDLKAAVAKARPDDVEAHKDIYCEPALVTSILLWSNVQRSLYHATLP